jgi:hypothetical protein
MITGITNATERTYLIIIGHGQIVPAIIEVGQNAHHNETWEMETFYNEEDWNARLIELNG